MYVSFIIMLHTSIPVFWSTGGLLPRPVLMVMEQCFLERPESRFSGKVTKQVFQTPEGLAASISTEPFRSSGGGFSDQITSERVQTSLR